MDVVADSVVVVGVMTVVVVVGAAVVEVSMIVEGAEVAAVDAEARRTVEVSVISKVRR